MSLYRMILRGEVGNSGILLQILIERALETMRDEKFKERSRKKATFFTRKRKMPFEKLIAFMLTSQKCSTNTALRRFFKEFRSTVTMKQQSYSEARAKVKVDALKELFEQTVLPMIGSCNKTWNGYRVFAVDGTTAQLPSDEILGKHFGTLGSAGSAPTARASIVYDVLNDIIADAAIEPMRIDERTLAERHIDRISGSEFGLKKLIVFDRGYPSFELIEKLISAGIFFVMRVKSKWNKDVDAQTDKDGFVAIKRDDSCVHLRVVKFPLDSDETEVLITNVYDARLGTKAFKKLYFLRWPIETKYNAIKNKLALEMFSSRTVEGIQQDFFATMFLSNLVSAAIFDAQPSINKKRAGKTNKFQYHANLNEAIGIMKDWLVHSFSTGDPDVAEDVLLIIREQIIAYVTPYRPNRSTPRKPPRKSKFHHNARLNC